MSISGDKIQIRFAHAPVTLKLDIAGAMLEAAEAPPKLPGKTRTLKKGTTARSLLLPAECDQWITLCAVPDRV